MFQLNALLSQRAEAKSAAEKLLTNAVESRQEMRGEALSKYNILTASIKNIDGQLDAHQAGAHLVKPSAEPSSVIHVGDGSIQAARGGTPRTGAWRVSG